MEFCLLWNCCCILWVQEGVDSEKLQSSERTVKSRAILGRSGANGIVPDQVEVFFFGLFFQLVFFTFRSYIGLKIVPLLCYHLLFHL